VIDAFGPERCLYGSNFPKEQFDSMFTYAQNVELFVKHLTLSDNERRWILGGTAATVWRWG
jgi:predicted TIM-barrel fold metal-dependent hydrolase